MPLRAPVLNCSLEASPATSNTQALAETVIARLEEGGVATTTIRVVDLDVEPGVTSDEGGGDEWPRIHEAPLASEILVVATPTWVGRPSSLAQRVLERMDAMISETADDGTPVAYGRVAGVVVTGNEDGAHHVIAEIAGRASDPGAGVIG